MGGTNPAAPSLGDLWPQVQRLRSLAVVGTSDDDCLGPLVLPELRHLARRSGSLTKEELERIVSARCPRLAALTIGVGRDTSLRVADFASLLSGERFPVLKKLALEQCPFADELVALLASSKILPRLTHLSLYQSSLTGHGAGTFAKHAAAFSHLEYFSIRETALTEAEGAALFAVLPVVGEHNGFLAPEDELYLLKNYQTRFWEGQPGSLEPD